MRRIKKIISFLALYSVLSLLISSNNLSAETSYQKITVEGNYRIETSTIKSYADIPLNTPISKSDINEALKRLVESKLFANVEIRAENKTVEIIVKEFPMINEISFEGNDSLNDDQLLALISSEPLKVYNSTIAAADADNIAKAYGSVGRISADVKPFIIRRSDNRVDLVFEVFEGKVIEIRKLSFVGNRNFSDSRLRRVLQTKQAGLLRRFKSNDVFSEDRIELDKQLLRDFYTSRGYIDFKILSVTSALTRQRDSFFVTFKIEEGFPYSIGEVTISSNLSAIKSADFQEILNLKSGIPFSPSLIDAAMIRAERFATESGMSFVRVDPNIDRNDDDRTLDINFNFFKGKKLFVERIDISGNSTTIDRVIRQQFDTVEGDPFNPRQIRESVARINSLRFFEPVNLDTKAGSDEEKVILDVKVKEVPTGSLSFGASYGQTVGLGGNLKIEQRNLLGRGQRLSLALDTSENSQTTSIGFGEPYFFGRDLGFDLDLFNTNTVSQFSAYDTNLYGLRPSLSFPVSQYGESQLFYSLGGKRLRNLTSNSSLVLNNEPKSQSESKLGITYFYDTRKKGYNPDAGAKIKVSQEFAGLGGTNKHIKTNALIGGQLELFSGNLTLIGEAEVGRLQSLSGNSSVLDRYFANGSIKGFEPNGLGPRDINAVNKDALGGNMFSAVRLEANFPIGILEESGISGGSFFDVGSVWKLDSTAGTSGAVDDSLSLRSSIGMSLFWKTVIGPLRINYAVPMMKKTYDKTRMLDLTISTQF